MQCLIIVGCAQAQTPFDITWALTSNLQGSASVAGFVNPANVNFGNGITFISNSANGLKATGFSGPSTPSCKPSFNDTIGFDFTVLCNSDVVIDNISFDHKSSFNGCINLFASTTGTDSIPLGTANTNLTFSTFSLGLLPPTPLDTIRQGQTIRIRIAGANGAAHISDSVFIRNLVISCRRFDVTPVIVSFSAASPICSGTQASITVNGTPSGVVYNWIRNNTTTVSGTNSANNDPSPIQVTLSHTATTVQTVSFTITPTLNGCIGSAQVVNVDVNPTPTINTLPGTQTICDNQAVTLSIPLSPTGAQMNWTRNNTTNIAGSTSANGVVSPISEVLDNITTTNQTTTFNITPVFGSCPGLAQTVDVVVRPTPTATITATLDSICSGSNTSIQLSGTPGTTTFDWSRNNTINATGSNSATGAGSPISVALTNTTLTDQTTTFTITPVFSACPGTSFTAEVVVRPVPTITVSPNPPNPSTICDLGITNIVFNDSPNSITGTRFSWTRNNTTSVTGTNSDPNATSPIAIGLNNTTNVAQQVTFTITPFITIASPSTQCLGLAATPMITVQPEPTVTILSALDPVCDNTATNITFNSSPQNVSGTVFNWARSTPAGLTGTNSGTVTASPLQITLNNTTQNTIIPVTFTITPEINGCIGTPQVTTFDVMPTPTGQVSSVPVPTTCSGIKDTLIILNAQPANVANTLFSWTRTGTGIIGLLPVTNGNSFLIDSLVNTTATTQTVTYTITPSVNGCAGSSFTQDIIVFPKPNLGFNPATQKICSGESAVITLNAGTPSVSGTTFSWFRDQLGNISGITDENNIPGPISVPLVNNGNQVRTVTISIFPEANGCSGDTIVTQVTVNPKPSLTSNNLTSVICEGDQLNIALSNTPTQVSGTSFIWSRNNISNVNGDDKDTIGPNSATISNVLSLSSGVIIPQNVVISIVPEFDGCLGDTTLETVVVNPVPIISGLNTKTICSGDPLNYLVTSDIVSNVVYSWTGTPGGAISGEVTQNAQSNNLISDILVNNSVTTVNNTNYSITTTFSNAGKSCTSTPFNLNVIVNPKPTQPVFTELLDPDTLNGTTSLCGGTSMLAMQISNISPGINYIWSVNPSNLIVEDSVNTVTAISFPDTSVAYQAVISAIAQNTVQNGSCKSEASQVVINVSSGDAIEEKEIVPKEPGHLLVYLDNSSDLRYHWGYDSIEVVNANTKRLVSPTFFKEGQFYQMFVPSAKFIQPAIGSDPEQLDTIHYAYWVQVIKVSATDTCYTRVYYNGPYCTTCGNRPTEEFVSDEVKASLWPNPNRGNFTVAVSGDIYGRIEASVVNSLGQIVSRRTLMKDEPLQEYFYPDDEFLPGFYQLQLLGNQGEKVTSKFVILSK